jgi:hypothetical protein
MVVVTMSATKKNEKKHIDKLLDDALRQTFCSGRSGWVTAPTEKLKGEVADLVLHPAERNITGKESTTNRKQPRTARELSHQSLPSSAARTVSSIKP